MIFHHSDHRRIHETIIPPKQIPNYHEVEQIELSHCPVCGIDPPARTIAQLHAEHEAKLARLCEECKTAADGANSNQRAVIVNGHRYESAELAGYALGYSGKTIRDVASGRRTCRGFKARFAE